MDSYLKMSKKDFIKKFSLITFGSLVISIGLNLFIIPSQLLSGGLSGICLIIQYLTKIPVGYTLLVLNLPLFALSLLKINKKFTLFTIIGTVALSSWLIITAPLIKILAPVPDANKLLYCIYGGVLNGIGLGIVFTNEGSTGGLDIISMYAKKKFDIDLGIATFAINFIIVTIGSFIFNFKVALYTLTVMYITSTVMEKVIKGLSKQKCF